jgi:hypothetical protein
VPQRGDGELYNPDTDVLHLPVKPGQTLWDAIWENPVPVLIIDRSQPGPARAVWLAEVLDRDRPAGAV